MTEPTKPGRYDKHRMTGPSLDDLRIRCGLPPKDAYKGDIPCKGCKKIFCSPDRRAIRFCPTCKNKSTWKGSQESDALYPADVGGITFQLPLSGAKVLGGLNTESKASIKKVRLVKKRAYRRPIKRSKEKQPC
jgi:hypothetical protein